MKNIILFFSLLFLVGCGSSSDTKKPSDGQDINQGKDIKKTINNSSLTQTNNRYGYYGENVIFGEETLVGTWYISFQDGEVDLVMDATFGEFGLYESNFFSRYYDYGVSEDGKIIKASNGENFIFQKISETKKGGDICYDVKLKSSSGKEDDILFCKNE